MTTAYKGFDQNFQCRGFQYEVGETYEHEGKVKQCESGFHACPAPLDVFAYYPPAQSRYAVVEQDGDLSDGDDKIASSKLTVKAEISLFDMVKAHVEWVKSKSDKKLKASETGYRSAATNTGDSSAATNTGDSSAATNTGYRSAATNTGYRSAATNTGDSSAATNTGDSSAATNTGDSSAATNTGDSSAASVEGKESIAIAAGWRSKAKAAEGSWIVVVERNNCDEILNVRTAKAGEEIKPDTWYTLVDGEFVEA